MPNSNNNQITEFETRITKSILANLFVFSIPIFLIIFIVATLIFAILILIIHKHTTAFDLDFITFVVSTPFTYSLILPQLSTALLFGAIIEIVQSKKRGYIIDIPYKLIQHPVYSFFFWTGIIPTIACSIFGIILTIYIPCLHQID